MKHISPNNKSMKIGFFTPYLHSPRGNSTTARRIVSGLRGNGFSVEVFAYSEDHWNQQAQARMESCDLFHILHFGRFSTWQLKFDFHLQKPYVVTSGGTDVNERLEELSSRRLLLGASALTVFTDEAAKRIIEYYPQLKDKVKVVPQTIWIPANAKSVNNMLPDGFPKVLLPSGVRKVKDVFYLIDEVETVVDEYPQLQFVIVGEPIEQDEVERVTNYAKRNEWFTYLGSVTVESMASIYDWADVVLNTSISEGQPIALMEAMYYRKPVLARRNAGNESLITNGINGYLFEDPEEFRNQFIRLINDKGLYEQVSNRGREVINEKFSLMKEIQQYIEIYQNIRGEQH